MHHPETTKFNDTYSQIRQTIDAIVKIKRYKNCLVMAKH